jgi:hypothetical protein
MDKDLLLVAKDDELGRMLQDLPVRKRASKRKKRGEYHSFEYDPQWLSHGCIFLDPDIRFYTGRQYKSSDKTMFGMFDDSNTESAVVK